MSLGLLGLFRLLLGRLLSLFLLLGRLLRSLGVLLLALGLGRVVLGHLQALGLGLLLWGGLLLALFLGLGGLRRLGGRRLGDRDTSHAHGEGHAHEQRNHLPHMWFTSLPYRLLTPMMTNAVTMHEYCVLTKRLS